MLKTPGSVAAPQYLEEGLELHCVVQPHKRFGPKQFESKDPGHRGKPVFKVPFSLVVLDGEHAGFEFDDVAWVSVDPVAGMPYGNNTKIQNIWLSAGIAEACGKDENGEQMYPFPGDIEEAAHMITGEGEYGLEDMHLADKIVRIQTAAPRAREFKGKTYHDTSVAMYLPVEDEDRKTLMMVAEAMITTPDDDDDTPF